MSIQAQAVLLSALSASIATPVATPPLADLVLTAPLWAVSCPDDEAWLRGDRATRAEQQKTRARVRATCEALGASDEACDVVDAITIRESDGDTCAVHVQGHNEYGLGAHGISWRWHRRRWDPSADADVLRIPEVSTVIVIRILRNAARRSTVRNWADANEVFAGRVKLTQRDSMRKNAFCHRLRRHGVDCSKPPSGLGDKLGLAPTPDQGAFVTKLLRAHVGGP